jgi:hypothetical protein
MMMKIMKMLMAMILAILTQMTMKILIWLSV